MSILHPLTALDQQINLTACHQGISGLEGQAPDTVFTLTQGLAVTMQGDQAKPMSFTQPDFSRAFTDKPGARRNDNLCDALAVGERC